MIIIGEKLNSSIPSTFEAMQNNDRDYITKLANLQFECGADYIDINTALFENEAEKMISLIDMIMPIKPKGISVDSTNPKTIEAALGRIDNTKIIINSISLQQERLNIIPIAKEYGAGVIALPADEKGIPKTAESRVQNADKLICILTDKGIKPQNIYLDIVAEALSTDYLSGKEAIKAILSLKQKYPEIHLNCGLSNISFGLPKRKYLNAAFLTASIFAGLDTAILDITSPDIRMALKSALLISGQDEYCTDYIEEFRKIF